MRIKPHLNGALLYVCQISLTSRFQQNHRISFPYTTHFVFAIIFAAAGVISVYEDLLPDMSRCLRDYCTQGFPTDPAIWVADESVGETVRKVKYSSVRIENPLLALYRGEEYFSLARTFRAVLGVENQ